MKNQIFSGGEGERRSSRKTNIYGGLLKKGGRGEEGRGEGGLRQFADLRGGWCF